jgi:hypothetical protein
MIDTLVLGHSPHAQRAVAAARGERLAVGRKRHGVNPVGVAFQLRFPLGGGRVPDGYTVVVGRGGNRFSVGRHSDAGHHGRPLVAASPAGNDLRGMNNRRLGRQAIGDSHYQAERNKMHDSLKSGVHNLAPDASYGLATKREGGTAPLRNVSTGAVAQPKWNWMAGGQT